MTKEEILNLHGIGKSAMKEFVSTLEENGLSISNKKKGYPVSNFLQINVGVN